MKIILFKGGLGNQMFQFVFYNYIKNGNKENIYGYYGKKYLNNHNGFEIDKVFENINLPKESILSNIIVNIYRIKNVILRLNKSIGYINGNNLRTKNTLVYDGYWQNLIFFNNDTISLFKYVEIETNDVNNSSLLKLIKDTQSISIHIRRGDYLNFSDIYGNICDKNYYNKAIERFKEFKDVIYIFFSDDVNWVKGEFSHISNSIFVDWNTGSNSYIDMYLMSNCKHNIIANSSFSWWGAYLNNNPDKIVIAPKKWFKSKLEDPNIFPPDWIRI